MTDGPPKLTPTQIGGAVFAALAVPWLGSYVGSFTGTQGTVAGTAIGSILPVVAGWFYLRFTYHAKAGLARVPWREVKPWHIAVASPVVAAAVFVVGMATVTGVEAKVLHKSLSASVTGRTERSGTTLGGVLGDTPSPSASGAARSGATFALSPSPSIPSVTVTVPTGSATPAITATPAATPDAPAPVAPARAPSGVASPSPVAPTGRSS
jgi:hypothetical protein